MHLHILGICGTFMAGIAQIARQLGHRISGSDANAYPPMSTLLESMGVRVCNGYDARNIPEDTELCIIGNAMTRGNPEVEHILNSHMAFESGPEWLRRHVLQERKVIAIAGTHGKTTTTSMVSWILDHAGLNCGFLVGGVPGNFDVSARLGDSPWFVIEADEYDTAFFDKRSKFVHYRPHIALLNNLEFDHADIFGDLEQIKIQIHHLVRTIPENGTIVVNGDDRNIADALSLGCWSRISRFSPTDRANTDNWHIGSRDPDYGRFEIVRPDGSAIPVSWPHFGAHNASNALAAAAVCHVVGVPDTFVADGLNTFQPPRRRLQLIAESGGVRIYEDFAHHPTAIAGTIGALSARHPDSRVICVLEPRSNTMRLGVHNQALGEILSQSAACLMLRDPGMRWEPEDLVDSRGRHPCEAFDSGADLIARLMNILQPGDVVALMSNGSFQGIPAILAKSFASGREPGGKTIVSSTGAVNAQKP